MHVNETREPRGSIARVVILYYKLQKCNGVNIKNEMIISYWMHTVFILNLSCYCIL